MSGSCTRGLWLFLSFAHMTLEDKDGKEQVKDPYGLKLAGNSLSSELLYFVTLNLDMKISYLLFAVLLLVLQSTLGFMRVPNNEAQCKQAGGTCSMDRCPLRTRSFGRCQRGIPCCKTVYD
uniref:Beta-defensin-like domain-containing protein n=1 Tax=Dromaius novaehollandiae TaxID=8790 RepID=A0A8C4KKA7_DRONO